MSNVAERGDRIRPVTVVATLVLGLGVVVVNSSAFGDDGYATVSGSDARIQLERQSSLLFLNVGEAARAFGWLAKIVTPGKLLTICRDEKDGVCVPLRLSRIKTLKRESVLFVEATVVAQALRFRIDDDGDRVTLKPELETRTGDPVTPAYNAAWGAGRGFRIGRTLPDIPLYDMQGDEVRFSQFLGRQYILYCWASW